MSSADGDGSCDGESVPVLHCTVQCNLSTSISCRLRAICPPAPPAYSGYPYLCAPSGRRVPANCAESWREPIDGTARRRSDRIHDLICHSDDSAAGESDQPAWLRSPG